MKTLKELREMEKAGELIGRFSGIPNDVYHAAPGWSNSRINKVRAESFKKSKVRKYTKPFALGGAFDELVLEPEIFAKHNSTKGMATSRISEGPEGNVWSVKDWDTLHTMSALLSEHKGWQTLVSKPHKKQECFFWRDEKTGLTLKCKADILLEGEATIIDLKTAHSTHPKDLSKSAADNGYHQQAAHYTDGVHKVLGVEYDFIFAAIEKTPPHQIEFFRLPAEALGLGIAHRDEGLETIRGVLAGEHSGGYYKSHYGIRTIDLPRWFYTQSEKGGEG